MSVPPSPSSSAAVAILVEDPGRLESVVAAVRSQSLEPREIFAVGGPTSESVQAAEGAGIVRVEKADELRASIPATIDHVWFLHDDVELRPDTLALLVSELERLDASVAGSKVLGPDGAELESIGGATDAFGRPVSVLDAGELDLGQYDVIRDAAFLSSVSLLIRRDLFVGLGGIDRMLPPESAGVDFANRARLAGGRVIIVPSSEVIHSGHCARALPPWRETAGQLRAMMKAYSALSLLWALPAALVIGLFVALGSLLIGRPGRVFDFFKSVAWNIKNSGSLIAGRRQLRAIRQVGDEELFRYQVRGSQALKDLWAELAAAVRAPLASSSAVLEWAEEHSTGRSTAVLGVGLAAWFATVRSVLFDGLPFVGWTLPLGSDPSNVLATAMGGWNPVGLGSDGPPHPSASALAAIQSVVGPSAASILTIVAVGLGLFGFYRLLRGVGSGQWAAIVGAILGVAGPATAMLGQAGSWNAIVALGFLPWALIGVVRPLPSGLVNVLGLFARSGLAAVVTTAFLPGSLVLPAVVGLAAALVGGSWKSLPRGVVISLMAVPAVGSWGVWNSLATMTSAGPAPEWTLPLSVSAALGLLWLLSLSHDRPNWWLAGVGGVLLGGGAALARGLVPGREVATLGLVGVAAGVAFVTAVAFERISGAVGLVGRFASFVIVAAMAVVAVPLAGVLGTGSMGLVENDALATRVHYLEARDSGLGERAVLIGGELPGDSRTWEGLRYRVLEPRVGYEDSWLGRSGQLDAELEATLSELLEAPGLRVADDLSRFGVRWILAPPDHALAEALRGRLDVVELALTDTAVFELVDAAPAAASEDGPWAWNGAAWSGPGGGPVLVAINPTERFPLTDTEAGTMIGGGTGSISPQQDSTLRLAMVVAAAWAGLLGLGALLLRRRP